MAAPAHCGQRQLLSTLGVVIVARRAARWWSRARLHASRARARCGTGQHAAQQGCHSAAAAAAAGLPERLAQSPRVRGFGRGGGGGGVPEAPHRRSRHASCVCTEWCAPCHLSGSQRPRVCCAAGSCACAHRPQATLNMVPGGVCVFVCGAGQPVLVRMCRLHPTSAPVCCVSRGESERVWRGMVDGRRVRALRRCRAF
jgi:hypothetical protein